MAANGLRGGIEQHLALLLLRLLTLGARGADACANGDETFVATMRGGFLL
jgi:hypothetical protein